MALRGKILAGLALGVGASMLYAAPAAAQASRTWVSGVGDDVNPCSRTAPCKTFAGTIAKTAAGGEINCLDPGGWGAVTITKSITIDCSQFPGSILNSGTNGISVINTLATDKVVIRGLELNAASLVSPGASGIRFGGAGTLLVEDVVIRGNTLSGGLGINFMPNGVAKLYLNNVTISNNGNATTGGGIDVIPQAGGSASVVLHNVRVFDNSNFAFRANTTNTTAVAGIVVSIDDSSLSGNTIGFTIKVPASTTTVSAMITNSTIANNSGQALLTTGASVTRVGNTTITGNGTALQFGGGAVINTYGDNRVNGNTNEVTTFTLPAIPKS
jgi:hypothetical protein